MILQALNRCYEDLAQDGKIARPGWAKAKISYALCINDNGELEQVVPLLTDSGKKKPSPREFDLPAPVKRTVGIAANFLWDNSAYLLGVDNKGKPERSADCFKACGRFHHQLLDGVESPDAKALLRFFDAWIPANASENPALQGEFESVITGANLIFRVNGAFPHEDKAIQEAWQNYYALEEGEKRQCLITGREDVIAAVHPSIKGVQGAQSSGAALVSFNAPAFCSYGKEQNFNAPVGKSAAFAYTAALNYLIADREHVQRIGDATVVCWAEGAESQYPEFFMAEMFGGPPPEGFTDNDLYSAVKRLADGLRCEELNLDPNRSFYILGVSPNAARLSVRFFYRDTFGRIMRNVNEHHQRMEIVRPSFDKFETIPLWKMLQETVNMNARDKSPSPVMAGATARAIFSGTPYPAALLENTMLRIHAEREITRGRAAILKAYYLRNPNEGCPEEVLTVALNEESKNEAYALGRLFSLYEAVQLAANPGIKATIKDKYFNAASTTPGAVFPTLDSLCQKHLRKLEAGQRIWYEKQILRVADILGEAYPIRLDLPRQGAFDLGYYHQTQARYAKKEES
ncbi:MAG: type I-C CRISPR-associated protein Cas8c/Csd1 [Oscillibacter sp.]|nr:type I-C CRISPR-associated protein Cas8c/Csd1 [Oscillibacter sp.]